MENSYEFSVELKSNHKVIGGVSISVINKIHGTALFSMVVCGLSFLALREKSILPRETKYQSSSNSEAQITSCYSQLQQHLSEQRPYRDSSITLPKLAGQLGVTPNLLSETINNY